MIFHSRARDRVVYLLVLVVCIGLVGFTGVLVLRGTASRIGSWNRSWGRSSPEPH